VQLLHLLIDTRALLLLFDLALAWRRLLSRLELAVKTLDV